MIGDPAVSFFATAYNKGIRNYDADLAYDGLRKNAFPGGIRDHAGYEHSKDAHSGGMAYYIKMGYVPDGLSLIHISSFIIVGIMEVCLITLQKLANCKNRDVIKLTVCLE